MAEPAVVNRTPSAYIADGDLVRVSPGVTSYSNGTEGHGLRYAVLHLDEWVEGDRAAIVQVFVDALNAHPPALALLNPR